MKNAFKFITLLLIFSFYSCQDESNILQESAKINETLSPEKLLQDKDLLQFFETSNDLILNYYDELQQLNAKEKSLKIEMDKNVLLNLNNMAISDLEFAKFFKKSIEKNVNIKKVFEQIHSKVKSKYSTDFFNSNNFKKAAEMYFVQKEKKMSKARVNSCATSRTNCGRFVFASSLVCVAASGGGATLACLLGAAAGYDYCTAEYNNCNNQQ